MNGLASASNGGAGAPLRTGTTRPARPALPFRWTQPNVGGTTKTAGPSNRGSPASPLRTTGPDRARRAPRKGSRLAHPPEYIDPAAPQRASRPRMTRGPRFDRASRLQVSGQPPIRYPICSECPETELRRVRLRPGFWEARPTPAGQHASPGRSRRIRRGPSVPGRSELVDIREGLSRRSPGARLPRPPSGSCIPVRRSAPRQPRGTVTMSLAPSPRAKAEDVRGSPQPSPKSPCDLLILSPEVVCRRTCRFHR